MAIAIDGTGTITGISVGGLNDSIITSSELANGAVTAAKLAAGAGGKILQVQSHSTTTRSSEALASNSAGTTKWLTVNITPSSTSSKIIIFYNLSGSIDYSYYGTILRRGTTPINVGTSAGSRAATTTFLYTDPTSTVRMGNHTSCFVDSPGVTTQLDYNVIVHNSNNGSLTFYANSTVDDTNDATLRNRTASSIIVAEYLP